MDRSSEQAQRLETLFEGAVELDADARAVYLDLACGDAPDLRREVESLLAAFETRAADVRRFLEGLPTAAPSSSLPRVGRGAQSPPELAGRVIAQYRILEKLGGGGMGVVYKAEDLRLDRTVALKFLPPYLGADEQAKARLIHEARTASALDHANIGAIHDIGETQQGQLFIVMAFYDGETLRQKIDGGRLPVPDTLDVVVQVARGLEKTHAAGIVHRDVKPANLLLTADREVKILDFGIAKVAGISLTGPGVAHGTLTYMSPEQLKGRDVDHRTDLWALGTVLYEMLTGEQPFRGDHPQAVIYSILNETPKPIRRARPEVSEALAQIVEALLQKDPDARYQTATELLADLRSLAGNGEAVQPDAGWTSKPRTDPRRLASRGSAAAAVLVLAVLGYFVGHQRSGSARAFPPVPLEARRSSAVLPLERFVGEHRNVQGLRAEAARPVAQEIEGKLTREDRARPGPAPPVDPRAYELYRQGLHIRGRPGEPQRERIQKAKSYFEQAIALDPTYAAAHAGLGREYFALGLHRVLSWDEAMPQAQRHLATALRLDAASGEAYALRGSLLQVTGDWTGAEAALRRAIESSPEASRYYCDLALLLMRRGRLEEAKELVAYALVLDPISYYAYQVGVQAYVYSRQYDEAIALSRKVLELYPEHWSGYWGLGLAFLGSGLHAEALAVLEGRVAADSRMLAPLGYAYAVLGRRGEAHEVVEALKARDLGGDLDNMYVSRIHIALGEREAALVWLEQFGQADYYLADPVFDPLRSEPRFQALLRKVGLEG